MNNESKMNCGLNNFNPIIVLFLTTCQVTESTTKLDFNPIIVLFLTIPSIFPELPYFDFNPIIVLFLTFRSYICI